MSFNNSTTSIMDRQLFQQDKKQSMIKDFLQAHGSQSLESLRAGFTHENIQLPFSEMSDEAYHEWLLSIDGISYRLSDNTKKYFLRNPIHQQPQIQLQCLSPVEQTDELLDSHKQSTPNIRNITPNKNTSIQRDRRNILNQSSKLKKHNEKSPKPKSWTKTRNMDGHPNIYDFTLMGDQNFLNYALFDLGFKQDYDHKIRQSGFCVSGLRIKDATKLVYNNETFSIEKIIVNVGSVDIAEGRQLIEIIQDFDLLLDAFQHKGITAVLTTLPPLPNHMMDNKNLILKFFNEYIRKCCSLEFPVIDLHVCMVKSNGTANLDLYQREPRRISGTYAPVLLLNKIGRTRIERMLRKNLGFALVRDHNFVGQHF